jgi:hypothetical protein
VLGASASDTHPAPEALPASTRHAAAHDVSGHDTYPVPPRTVEGADPSAPEWQALAGLLTGYLNQGVGDEYGSIEGGFAAFAREWPRDDVWEATGQAHRLLERFPSEESARAAAESLGLAYHPPSAGQSYRTWLVDLQQFLRRAAP